MNRNTHNYTEIFKAKYRNTMKNTEIDRNTQEKD